MKIRPLGTDQAGRSGEREEKSAKVTGVSFLILWSMDSNALPSQKGRHQLRILKPLSSFYRSSVTVKLESGQLENVFGN